MIEYFVDHHGEKKKKNHHCLMFPLNIDAIIKL